ncbi:ACT domain-containing protein [Testudinibacter sp. P80/BLE/0925]|uniref:ACT domain-containing protein n=1 Tax=Testudinibacter sp. TW-1 TaxID=3417757 RepID=UPI003D36E65F
MNNSVLTVIGKDRIGIVYDVAKLLAEQQINIVNISQQLMNEFFTMIVLVDTSACAKDYQTLSAFFVEEGKKLGLELRLQNTDIFNAMHRI